jgi:Coenzyme PQQ synthesis protein D (PqqD)
MTGLAARGMPVVLLEEWPLCRSPRDDPTVEGTGPKMTTDTVREVAADAFGHREADGAALPLASPRAVAVCFDDRTAIYDDRAGALIMFNPSCSALWRRCSGRNTLDQIVADIAAAHDGDEARVRTDVWLTLRKLAVLGLITDMREERTS